MPKWQVVYSASQRNVFLHSASTVALHLLVTRLPSASAQKSSASCVSGWDWSRTDSGDSPCLVAAKLLSLCSYEPFTLDAGGFYTPSVSSSSSLRANTCGTLDVPSLYSFLQRLSLPIHVVQDANSDIFAYQVCNVAAYNLLSACQSCQESGASILSWSNFASACSTCSSTNGIAPGPCGPMSSIGFPNSVKPKDVNIEIPSWATNYNSSGGSTFTYLSCGVRPPEYALNDTLSLCSLDSCTGQTACWRSSNCLIAGLNKQSTLFHRHEPYLFTLRHFCGSEGQKWIHEWRASDSHDRLLDTCWVYLPRFSGLPAQALLTQTTS